MPMADAVGERTAQVIAKLEGEFGSTLNSQPSQRVNLSPEGLTSRIRRDGGEIHIWKKVAERNSVAPF